MIIGAVWNAADLMAEHDSPGREFPHFLASAYAEGGPAVLHALRGSFGVVLYDGARRRALVAGDQFASYSLYYARAGDDVFFASETELLLNALPRRPRPDPSAIVASLGGGGVPEFTTWYAGVHRVVMGAFLEIEPNGLREHPYWRPE